MSAPEHSFGTERLISGDAIRGYTAASDLVGGEPVGVSGSYEVDASGAGEGDFIGVVLYDVTAGEEPAIANEGCEVRVPVSEAVDPGDELLPDGSAEFETVATSGGSTGVAVVLEGTGGAGTAEVFIYGTQGATA